MQTNRSNTGALVAGAVLIACGLLALGNQFLRITDWAFVGPLAVVAAGALFFLAMIAGGRQSAAFAVPGSIISGIGLTLLFASITDQWELMSYLWTLIIVFVGIGVYLMGWYGGDPNQKRSGWGVIKVGLILFIIFGGFFELVFSSNNLIFPVLLILLGAYLILSRAGLFGGKKIEGSSDQSLPPAS
jgi:hypothetical protein